VELAAVAGIGRIDMRYMCLLYGEAGAGPAPGSAEFARMLADYGSATEAMVTAGVWSRRGMSCRGGLS
jgi:hypothetical protein